MIFRQSRQYFSSGSTPVVRSGVLGLMASFWVRRVVLLALAGSSLPQIAAVMLMLGSFNADHEVQCRFESGRVEITLHHRRDLNAEETTIADHRHTLIERCVVGRCESGDESDHYFGFDRQSVLAEEVEFRLMEVAQAVGFEPADFAITNFDSELDESIFLSHSLEVESGPSPPLLMRRGVVMRL